MKTLQKLKIINFPKKDILADETLFHLMGAINCGSYVVCGEMNKNYCNVIYNNAPCELPEQAEGGVYNFIHKP